MYAAVQCRSFQTISLPSRSSASRSVGWNATFIISEANFDTFLLYELFLAIPDSLFNLI